MKLKTFAFFTPIVIASSIQAQTVRTWGGGSGSAWLTTTNWSPTGNFAGDASASVSGEGAATDIMAVAAANAATNIGINMNSLTVSAGGLGLSLGGIDFNKTSTVSLQIGNSSTTANGLLQLNGATIEGVAKTLVRVDGSANLTIANVNTGSGTQTMGLRLGITDGIFQVAGARTLTISSNITELTASSGFTKTGAGQMILSGTNSYTGGTTVNAGTLLFRTTASKAATGTHTFATGSVLGLGFGTGGFTAADIQNAFAGVFTGNLAGISIGSSSLIAIDSQGITAFSANIGPSTNGLAKMDGTGNLNLTGANQYSGRTVVGGGNALVVNSLGNKADASSNIGTNGTIDLLVNARIDHSLSFSSDKDFNVLGSSMFFGNATLAATLSGSVSTETAGVKTFTFQGNAGTAVHVFSGSISDGSGQLAVTKAGASTWTFSSASTYTGATSVSAGILNIQHANALGSTTAGTTVANAATLQLQGGITTAAEALTLTPGTAGSAMLHNVSGNNTWSGSVTSNTGTASNVSRLQSDAGKLTISGAVSLTGSAHQLVFQGDGAFDISGQITGVGRVTSGATGAGLRTVSNDTNTYTGSTSVNGGVLAFTSIANVGAVASSLGAPALASSVIAFGAASPSGATLRYVGTETAGHASDRVINLSATGNATIEASGVGPLVLTGVNTATGSGSKTLTLGGTNTGNNSIGVIVNNTVANTTSVTKADAGTWVLSATNSYTGRAESQQRR